MNPILTKRQRSIWKEEMEIEVALEFIMSNIEDLSKSIENCEAELKAITKPIVVPNKKQIEEEVKDLADVFSKANYEQKRAIDI